MICMNEEKTIRLFLKNGFQISKNALGLVSDDPRVVISKLKKIKPRPFIITEEHIKNVCADTTKKQINIKIIKKYDFDHTPSNVNDYVEELSYRYERIKLLLFKQMASKKLVSINKINPRTTTFSIIGIVRKKNDNSILIEDPTGETNLHFDKNTIDELKTILLDDVIGIQCKKIKEKYYVKKFFYPDILSSRSINKTKDEIKVAVAYTSSESNSLENKLTENLSIVKKPLTLFLFSHQKKKIVDKIPSKFKLIQIESDAVPIFFELKKIKILAIPQSFLKSSVPVPSPEVFLSILKRRELTTPSSLPVRFHKNFILDKIPDIIISDFGKTFYQNYKGTTIISNSDHRKIFFVDLKTREVQKIQI